VRVVPEAVEAFNPAFDVTPNEFVTAIITERGIARSPYGESLARLAALTAAAG
jgi:methylthioribose-1-phosphate isomerase